MFQFETIAGLKRTRDCLFISEKNKKVLFHIRSLLFLAFLPETSIKIKNGIKPIKKEVYNGQ